MAKRLPTEFSINMYLDKLMILQQQELKYVNQMNYFDASSPCHLYFIGKRPRVIVDKDFFEITEDYIGIKFLIQYKNQYKQLPLKLENKFRDTNIKLNTKYPYNSFELILNNKQLFWAKASTFIQTYYRKPYPLDFLDFEVLYIGQSYGVEGARTAADRLVNHSTLQGIYAEAITNNPDSEIWIALASFSQLNLVMFDGISDFTDEEKSEDKERFSNVFGKLNYEGINEQQKINLTEAALTKYFEPPYNKIYKNSFPNPAHKTYSECYDLNINSVCFEMHNFKMANYQFYP